jgi:hypothetical protein
MGATYEMIVGQPGPIGLARDHNPICDEKKSRIAESVPDDATMSLQVLLLTVRLRRELNHFVAQANCIQIVLVVTQ